VNAVDIDRFMAENRSMWDRLDYLTWHSKKLSGPEIRELSVLYQRTAGQLAYAQAHFSDAQVIAALTGRVTGTYAVLYGTRRHTWRTIGRFFTETFPLTVWESRWFLLVSALALFVPALAAGVWVDHSHAALNAIMPAAVRDAYVNHDFSHYYSSEPSVDFATQVYLNNVEVAAEAFAGGIAFGLGTLLALFNNGLNVGAAGGLFYAAHRPAEFWGLITPHGLLELTSVVLAGAAGLRLGWALVYPGDYPRSVALGRAGPQAFVLVMGTVLTLAVAGSIEGFVTGSDLPTAVRVGIGVAVELTFLTWVVLFGRAARARRARDGQGSEPPSGFHVDIGIRHQWPQAAREGVNHNGPAGLQ
jgi:uncharacterized membrane protein SpoIIM required for sporulation